MSAKDVDRVVSCFIDKIRDKPGIWCLKDGNHKSQTDYIEAIEAILSDMKKEHTSELLKLAKLDTVKNMKSKWQQLRNNFYTRDKAVRNLPSGSAAPNKQLPKWNVSK